MMSFCKKSVHSLLGFSIPTNLDSDFTVKSSATNGHSFTSTVAGCGGGVGLITATSDSFKTPNVLESATVLIRSSSLPLPPPPPPPPVKKDPGGIGFIDDVGGGVDGLMSCTESLGFESCDERRVDDEIEMMCCTRWNSNSSNKVVDWKKVCGRRREVKKFPPPLSSLNHNGQPCFFLRPVRKDGRLELMEVRIDRPEILRASRVDGRLRLHLVRDEKLDDFIEEKQVQDEEIEQEEEIKEIEKAEEERLEEEEEETVVEEEEEETVVEEEEEEEEEETMVEEEAKRSEEWRFPVGGEGFRRCNEVVAHHHDYHRHHHEHNNHHHNLHVWSQHCVTTS